MSRRLTIDLGFVLLPQPDFARHIRGIEESGVLTSALLWCQRQGRGYRTKASLLRRRLNRLGRFRRFTTV